MQPLRIAFVVHTFDVGGLERGIARLVSNMNLASYEPHIVCLNRNGSASQWVDSTRVQIHELGKSGGNDPFVIGRLSRLFRKLRLDVVHSHNWGTLVETSLARALASVSVHVHSERGTVLGGLQMSRTRHLLRSTAARWCLRRADSVVTNAASVKSRLAKSVSIPAGRVEVIPNGVEPPAVARRHELRSTCRHQLGIQDATIVAGTVGRLESVKNLSLALHALAVVRDVADLQLLVVGNGSERERLASLADDLGVIGSVHFVGAQTETSRYFAAMDFYLNTSVSEGMSQSIVEALGWGLPVVATDVGDNQLLVSGHRCCGMVVDSDSLEEVAAAMSRLVEDTDLRTTCGENARADFDEHYSLDQMTSRYDALYQRLLARRRGTRLAS